MLGMDWRRMTEHPPYQKARISTHYITISRRRERRWALGCPQRLQNSNLAGPFGNGGIHRQKDHEKTNQGGSKADKADEVPEGRSVADGRRQLRNKDLHRQNAVARQAVLQPSDHLLNLILR